jgi:hypothetical protein
VCTGRLVTRAAGGVLGDGASAGGSAAEGGVAPPATGATAAEPQSASVAAIVPAVVVVVLTAAMVGALVKWRAWRQRQRHEARVISMANGGRASVQLAAAPSYARAA